MFSLDGFTNEILVTPVENILFRLCNRFLKYVLLLSSVKLDPFTILCSFESGLILGEASLGLVLRRRIHNIDSGIYPLQNKFWGLGPRGLQVTGVGVTVAPPFASSTGRVRFDVLAQMVTPHKALVTNRASKPFLTGVGAEVSLELIGPSEPFATEKPVADKRPLAGVPSQMCFEVRCLSVHFTAAGNVAAVESLPAQAGPGGSQPLSLLAVRAVTCCSAGVPPGRPRGATYS